MTKKPGFHSDTKYDNRVKKLFFTQRGRGKPPPPFEVNLDGSSLKPWAYSPVRVTHVCPRPAGDLFTSPSSLEKYLWRSDKTDSTHKFARMTALVMS